MRPPGEVLRRADWRVEPVGMPSCHELVGAFHYAGRGSNSATFRHGLFRADDWLTCLGVAWWIPPTRDAALAVWPDPDEVLTLSRLAIAPEVPTNGASFLVARSVRLIRRDGRYRLLTTYADESKGHTGAIYLAAGFRADGATKGEHEWRDRAGRIVNRKRGQRTLTTAQMHAAGYTRSEQPAVKRRFVLEL